MNANMTLAALLEEEHQQIDSGIEAFVSAENGDDRTGELTTAIQALRRHIYLEEAMVFPSLRAAGMVAPVFVMLREHGEIWRTLDELETGVASGADRTELLTFCAQLTGQLDSHNMKEEQILYPQTDGVLTGEATAELRAFLASGELPDGWACAQAGA